MGDNQHDIDLDQIAAEAARVEIPDDVAAPVGDVGQPADQADQTPPAEPEAAPWSSITPGLVTAIALVGCPNWNLSDDEKRALDEALAPALDQLFPGGMGDARWAPYFRLLFVVVGIAGARFDPKAMKLKPLHKPKSDDAAPAAAAAQGGSSFVRSA